MKRPSCTLPTLLSLTTVLSGGFGLLGTARADGTISSDLAKPAATATRLGATKLDQFVTVAIVLPLRNPTGIDDFISRAGTPGDVSYHKFLTPQQFATRFGADPVGYAAVAAWARAQGLKLGEASIARTVVAVTGSVAQIGAAFKLTLSDYQGEDGRVFYAADRAPSLPDSISSFVTGIVGLSDVNRLAPMGSASRTTAPRPDAGSGPFGAYSPNDLKVIYGILPQPSHKGTETMAVFEQGGFVPNDIAVFQTTFKIPNVPVMARNVNGWDGRVTNPDIALEAATDVDLELGINPAAKEVLVYEDGSDAFGVALLLSLTAMANDNKADVIDISYGVNEKQQGSTQIAAEGQIFRQLAAQGEAVFAAAGNGGAYGGNHTPTAGLVKVSPSKPSLNVMDPGSQPYVTSVGATTLYSNGYEEVWDDLSIASLASGGGVSAYWPIPAYQLDPNGRSVAILNGGSATQRNVPDVAAVGDGFTGVAVFYSIGFGSGPTWTYAQGTGVSSAFWAGFYSLIDSTSKLVGTGRYGFFNPVLYAHQPGISFIDSFDILDGTNGNPNLFGGLAGYSAGLGYDNVSGWGSIVQGGYCVLDYAVTLLGRGKKPPPAPVELTATSTATTVTLTWKPSAGAKAYLVQGSTYGENALPYKLVPTTTVTFQKLLPGRVYGFAVQAIDPTGIAETDILYSTASH